MRPRSLQPNGGHVDAKILLLTLSLLMFGCENFPSSVSDEEFQARLDLDHDGIPRPIDCNDLNPDPKVSIRVWYRDVDQDGSGAGEKIIACDQPASTTITNNDCDDTRATVHPGATEICDGLDNDCNGKTDETFLNLGESCGTGVCANGTILCTSDHLNTVCSSDSNKNTEVCDGLDNDCNGKTDETFLNLGESCGTGVCANGTILCTSDHLNTVCSSDSNKNTEVCDGLDNDCNGQTDEPTAADAKIFFADVDQDNYGNVFVTKTSCIAESGYVADNSDCNDLEKNVHPNQKEICNYVDDNCNGETDEGVQNTYYKDQDTDGYGNLSKEITGCTAPTGYVANSADCNDGIKTIHPNAIEVCDNMIDDNCDGITDNAIEAKLWYKDMDADGFGNVAIPLYACAKPVGFVSDKTDCNDANTLVNPSATELCTDNKDNNCNGITDTDAKPVTWYLDADKDGFGDATKSKFDCAQPAGYVENALDCSDTVASIHPGAQEVCNNGVDDNCDGDVNQCAYSGTINISNTNAIQITGFENENFGSSVTTCDFNEDGLTDLLVGSSTWNANQGKVSIYLSPIKSGDKPSQEILGPTNGLFGSSLACITSKQGTRIAIGSPGYDKGGNSAGALFIFALPILPNATSQDANAVWEGTNQNSEVGFACSAIPDQDNDGQEDFLVSADGYNGGSGSFAGAGFVISSASTGTSAIQLALISIINKTKDELAGTAIAAGYLNSDASLDFILGAIASDVVASDAGVVYITFGPITGTSYTTNSTPLYGTSSFDNLGQSISSGFDLSGDTLEDILIGSPGNGGLMNSGFVQIARWNTKAGNSSFLTTTLESTFGGDRLGYSVSSGKINTDTFGDILVGAPGTDDAGSNFGSVFIQYGPILSGGDIRKTAHARIDGESTNGQLGWLVQITPDLNSDKVPDLVLLAKSTKPMRKLYILPGIGL